MHWPKINTPLDMHGLLYTFGKFLGTFGVNVKEATPFSLLREYVRITLYFCYYFFFSILSKRGEYTTLYYLYCLFIYGKSNIVLFSWNIKRSGVYLYKKRKEKMEQSKRTWLPCYSFIAFYWNKIQPFSNLHAQLAFYLFVQKCPYTS